MKFSVHENIAQIPAEQWNNLATAISPFIRHEFLAALEQHDCVGKQHGWIPQHAILHSDTHHIIGAIPMYLKFNSYGEFVFDWLWADAYHRYGKHYYPKLVIAAPYSPVPGQRILMKEDNQEKYLQAFISQLIAYAQQREVSSIHCLFGGNTENLALQQQHFCLRYGYQFHWFNHSYQDFDDFMSRLNNKKRKNIKKERRHVSNAGIRFRILHGQEITDENWSVFHRHYVSTFDRLGGYPSLTIDFFKQIAKTMGDQIVLFAAYDGPKHIASAFCLRDEDSLYGRHWGCDAHYHNLHFETCYYQGIDYCIQHGLSRFEPGAQGEHKISRGFLPTPTYSAHWIADTAFQQAIDAYLEQEHTEIKDYMDILTARSPYKSSIDTSI